MSMDSNSKTIISLDKLRLSVKTVFEKKLLNKEMLREVNEEFEKKGLNVKTLQLLLNDKIDVSNLSDYELIAISKIFYSNLGLEDLDVNKYFSEVTLLEYHNKIKVEEKINRIELKNFIKIDEFNYRGQIDYKDIYMHLNHRNFIYNHEAQRSPKYRTIGSKNGKGEVLRVENVNSDSVKEIAKSILDGVFEDTEIILNCEIVEGNEEEKFHFNPKYEDILGDIIIYPDYDVNSNSTTFVSITDGYHRCKGIVLAVSKHLEKTGEMLEGSIGVRLVRADKERAKRIVHQTFLRSSDEPEWIKSLVSNDYSKFVDSVLKLSRKLTASNTIEDSKVYKTLTSKSILIDVTKKMLIEFNKSSVRHRKSKALAENFDLIFDFAEEIGIKINSNRAIAYYYIAYRMLDADIEADDILDRLETNSDFISAQRRTLSNANNLNKYIKTINEVIGYE